MLDAGIFQQAAQALPDSLLIPEETTPKYYAYTAPFQSFLFHGDLGTDPSVYAYYPHAFSVNLINDVDPGKLSAAIPALTAAVKNGDVLITHGDYWQANNPTIISIYQAAGVAVPPTTTPTPPPVIPTPPITPPPATPVAPSKVSILTPSAGDTVANTVVVAGAINLTLDAAGSYLMVDGAEIGTQRASSAPFAYPLDTTMLSNGTHTLQLWAHDTANTTWLSNTVTITVANNTVLTSPTTPPATNPVSSTYPITLNYPSNGQAVSGVLGVTGAVTQTLDAAGSYVLIDGAEYGTARVSASPFVYLIDTTLLSVGQHTLQIWAHDIGNNTLLSNLVNVIVSR